MGIYLFALVKSFVEGGIVLSEIAESSNITVSFQKPSFVLFGRRHELLKCLAHGGIGSYLKCFRPSVPS